MATEPSLPSINNNVAYDKICTYVYTDMPDIYIYTCIHIYTYVLFLRCVRTYIHICTYTHTQTTIIRDIPVFTNTPVSSLRGLDPVKQRFVRTNMYICVYVSIYLYANNDMY